VTPDDERATETLPAGSPDGVVLGAAEPPDATEPAGTVALVARFPARTPDASVMAGDVAAFADDTLILSAPGSPALPAWALRRTMVAAPPAVGAAFTF